MAATAKNVSPDEAEALLKSSPKLIVLDVRTPDEFANGHIPGARNIDFFGDDFATQIATLDPTTPLLVHCASGSRSSRALEKITALKKFHTLYHLKAGLNGWIAAHKPVEQKIGGP